MSVHQEKEAASPLTLGALQSIQGGVATSGACAVCLRGKSQDKGRTLECRWPEIEVPLMGNKAALYRNLEGTR